MPGSNKSGRKPEGRRYYLYHNKPAEPPQNTTTDSMKVCSKSLIEQVIDIVLLSVATRMNTSGAVICIRRHG
jgi:hypothetical protein